MADSATAHPLVASGIHWVTMPEFACPFTHWWPLEVSPVLYSVSKRFCEPWDVHILDKHFPVLFCWCVVFIFYVNMIALLESKGMCLTL